MKTAHAYRFLPAELADRLRTLNLTVGRFVEGPGQGSHRSPHFGSSVEFAEYREYTPGDPPNRIDWAVYARSDRYMIRRYQEETNLRAYLLLDTSESMAFGEQGQFTKLQYACHVAAGLMYLLVSQGDAVGLSAFDTALRGGFPPAGSEERLRDMLLSLEDLEPSGRSDFEGVMNAVAERIHSRSLVIILSDLLQDPAVFLRGLRRLHHDRHALMVLHVLDPAELHLTAGGLAEYRELETGAKMIVEVDEMRDTYASEVQRYIEEVRRGCAACLAAYHLIDTRAPVDERLFTRLTRV